jgi:hypothetical protein
MNSNEQIQCELCELKYPSEMILDKSNSDFIQCYDCLFSMNFGNSAILNGSMGYNLTKYLEVSKKYHSIVQEIPCSKLNDNGGCYVCMSLLDIPFENPNVEEEQKIKIDIETKSNIQNQENKIFETHHLQFINETFSENTYFSLSL